MSKKRSAFKEFVIYLVVAPIMELTRLAPREFAYSAWSFVALLFWKFSKRRRNITLENLRSVYPNLPEEKLEEIGMRSVRSNVWSYMEFCWMGEMNSGNVESFVKVEGEENIKNSLAKGNGVILVFMHIYNGEMVSGALSANGFPVNWVVREVDSRLLDRKMDVIRSGVGLRVIKKEKAMRKMIQCLRSGEVLGFAADQKASLNGVWVKFLGRWSATVKSPAVLHFRTEAPIHPVFSYPNEDRTHTAYILPEIEYAPSGDKKKDVFLITQKIADLQTEFLHKHPEIWLWMHRRWSITPQESEIAESEKYLSEAAAEGFKTDCSAIR